MNTAPHWSSPWYATARSLTRLRGQLPTRSTFSYYRPAWQGSGDDAEVAPGVVTVRRSDNHRDRKFVTISCTPFPAERWQQAAETLRARNLRTAAALADALDGSTDASSQIWLLTELTAGFGPAGFQQAGEMRLACTCLQQVGRCPHRWEAVEELTVHLQRNPLAWLRWFGGDPAALAAVLRDVTPPAALADADPATFFDQRPFERPVPPSPGTVNVLDSLGPAPAELGGEKFVAALRQVYAALADSLADTLVCPAAAQPVHGQPTPALVRAWARQAGLRVGARGRLPRRLTDAYRDAHS